MAAPKTHLHRGRLVIYGIVFTLAGLLLIELAARRLEPIAHRKTRDFRLSDALSEYKLWQQTLFLSFGGVHQPDPELLWAFRPRLRQSLFVTNSRGLLTDEEIEYEKPHNTVRILLLGDSSPVGLGLRRRMEAFGESAARMLQEKWRGRKRIELINAAVSGYTSEQGRRFLQSEGIKYRPDFVVCYFGNNDASINGYLSDREILGAQQWARQARAALYRLATYRLLRNLISPVLPDIRAGQNDSPKVRLSPEEFGENMAAIAALTEGVGGKAIFVNPPIPYRWPAGLQFKIFSRMTDAAGQWVVADPVQRRLERPVAYCFDPAMISRPYGRVDPYVREVFAGAYIDSGNADSIESAYHDKLKEAPRDPVNLNNLGVLYWRKTAYRQAVGMFERSLLADSTLNVARYNLGIALADLGDSARARKMLHDAADCDYYSLRIKTLYREALFAAAAAGGAVILDAAGLFMDQGNEQLFIDHCHPTPSGHMLIAERLAGLVDSLLREKPDLIR